MTLYAIYRNGRWWDVPYTAVDETNGKWPFCRIVAARYTLWGARRAIRKDRVRVVGLGNVVQRIER